MVIGFKTMACTLGVLRTLDVVGVENFDNVLSMMTMYLAGDVDGDGDRTMMSDLLPDTRLREATDGRDRVYALLGIAARLGYCYPKPDYGASVTSDEVYIKYTRAIIEQEKRLNILSIKKSAPPRDGMPSWVYDPTTCARGRLMMRREGGLCPVGASGTTAPKLTQSSSPCHGSLGLYGKEIDRIAAIQDFDEFWNHLGHPSSRWRDILSQGARLADLLELHGSYTATAEDPIAAVLKTLAINNLWVASPLATRRYKVEAQELYASFILWKEAHSRDSASTTAEAAREYSGPLHTQDTLFRLCQLHFRFDRQHETHPTSSGVHADINDDEHLLEWLDMFVSESVRYLYADFMHHMKIAMTDKGFLALVPDLSEIGDKVCVLLGGNSSFVLRNLAAEAGYRCLGPAYVHGSADGRFVRDYEALGDDSLLDKFLLV